MSRIGNTPIHIPHDVSIETQRGTVVVKGVKGELRLPIPENITVAVKHDSVEVSCGRTDTRSRALHGLVRATIANSMIGVSRGWTKTLELTGVGYRANLSHGNLVLSVGFSHPVTIAPSPGVSFQVSEGKIIVSGIDRGVVGQVAATIRAVKKPEPYKGKGIRYQGEYVRRKAGKSVKAVGGVGGTVGVVK